MSEDKRRRRITVTTNGSTPVAAGPTVTLRDYGTGEPLRGIIAVTVNMRVGETIDAGVYTREAEEAEVVFALLDLGEPTPMGARFVCSPPTGPEHVFKTVKRIEFADGSVWEA